MPTAQNLKLTKKLSKRFKRSVFWNEYKSKIQTEAADNNTIKRIHIDSSFRGVIRLFVLGFDNTENDANQVEKK